MRKRDKAAGKPVDRATLAGPRKPSATANETIALLERQLKEALQQQAATAEILKVISRSAFDLQRVLETLVQSAAGLIGATNCTLCVRDGETFPYRAVLQKDSKWGAFLRANPARPGRHSVSGRVLLSGNVETISDVQQDAEYDLSYRLQGYRSLLGVPLLRDGKVEGVFTLSRPVAGEFTARQVDLALTFADQAVIAIENARLFSEVQERTHDLEEALRHQTGSANILNVIASSPTDVGPVLQAIVESACELCGAYDALVRLKSGGDLEFSAHHGPIPVTTKTLPIDRNSTAGVAVIERRAVHVHDLLTSEGDAFPEAQGRGRRFGHRTILSIPLISEGKSIGVIILRRTEVNPFSDKQVALLQTFANQAVIAIGNVRLFEQVQERTRELSESLQFQTATSDVLKVISRSPDALQPVLDVIVATSRELCGSDASTIFLLRDRKFHVAAVSGSRPTHFENMKANPPLIGQSGSVLSRVYDQKRTLHFANVMDDPELRHGSTGLGGARALLTVPLISEGQVVGAITLRQSHLRPFTPPQVSAIETFADQAVIAISNVQLFQEVQERTTELSQSLDDLRAAQDRLIQTEKLASLGQLTAGIAHEIKNPLNFVNNFSALSAELVDEVNDVLRSTELDLKPREELEELTSVLKSNLEKVIQHGKRADSIVKNMLQHSRGGSGEHRSADINAIVEDSLNLAYHGARAEKSGFAITLRPDFDPDAGTARLYPQEITRALLNLISNGFYAATMRKVETSDESFEPVLSASTRNLGNAVEIRIRDNGTGIPPGLKEKIFVPFFTTKPTGEGTGLGLSMTHDIIVKQHGGRIDVETEAGAFTEFIVTLPRDNRNMGGQKSE